MAVYTEVSFEELERLLERELGAEPARAMMRHERYITRRLQMTDISKVVAVALRGEVTDRESSPFRKGFCSKVDITSSGGV